jgi:hypothetical protein
MEIDIDTINSNDTPPEVIYHSSTDIIIVNPFENLLLIVGKWVQLLFSSRWFASYIVDITFNNHGRMGSGH